MQRELSAALDRLCWDDKEKVYNYLNTLADSILRDELVLCRCCNSFYKREGKYVTCNCVVYTEEYKNRTGDVGYTDPGYHDLDMVWMEKFYKDPDSVCYGECTIEGILGSTCRRCGHYVDISDAFCGYCLEKIADRVDYNNLLKSVDTKLLTD